MRRMMVGTNYQYCIFAYLCRRCTSLEPPPLGSPTRRLKMAEHEEPLVLPFDNDHQDNNNQDNGNQGNDVDQQQQHDRMGEIIDSAQQLIEQAKVVVDLQSAITQCIQSSSKGLDWCSVYVGNVDYDATRDQLEEHFRPCGLITRITILCDKETYAPKGYAYITFDSPKAVLNALKKDESLFLGRVIKVCLKRKNLPEYEVDYSRGRKHYHGMNDKCYRRYGDWTERAFNRRGIYKKHHYRPAGFRSFRAKRAHRY